MVELHPRGPVHVQRPPRRVAQRILGEQLRLDREAVEGAPKRPFPGGADRSVGLAQGHQGPAASGGSAPQDSKSRINSLVSASCTAAMLAAASGNRRARLPAARERLPRMSDEWRVEVNLDDEQHGFTLGERL